MFKILSIFLSAIVVFSTLSFAIEKHVCAGEVTDISFFGNADSCGMEMSQKASEEGCSLKKKNCCNDVTKLIKGQDQLNNSVQNHELSSHQKILLTSYFITYIDLFQGLKEQVIPYRTYVPPLVVKNIQTLYEIYLI